MEETDQPSEQLEELRRQTIFAWYGYNHEDAIHLIDNALQPGHTFSEREVEYLQGVRKRQAEVIDPDYMPPNLPTEDETYILHDKSRRLWKQRRFDESFRYNWLHVRYSTPGTNAFLEALSDLAQIAVGMDDDNLCLRATQAFFAMNDLMHAVADQQNELVEAGLPRDRPTLLREENHSYTHSKPSLPAWEAIELVNRRPDPCWLRVLETTLYEDEPGAKMYQSAWNALIDYYARTGDDASLDRLKRDFPRRTVEGNGIDAEPQNG